MVGKPSNKKQTNYDETVFFLLWASQLISLLGSEVVQFTLRIWTYQQTGSVAQFSLITFFTEAPALLLAPFAGAVVDRYPRKLCLVTSDLLAALATLAIAVTYVRGALKPEYIYVSNVINSLAGALQWPAFKATVSLVIPPDKLVRYGGLDQAAPAMSMLLSPVVAGIIASRYGLHGAFLTELFTFTLALCVTAVANIPHVPSTSSSSSSGLDKVKGGGGDGGSGGGAVVALWKDARESFSFVTARPGLLGLLVLLAFGHFSSGLVRVLMTPVLLNIGDASTLGYVLSVSGTGALVGALGLSLWGGPKQRKVLAVLACAFGQGFLLCLCGVVQSALAILGMAFLYMALIPLNRACRESIWQRKVPFQMQGRVFGLQKAISEAAAPLAALLGGQLADRVLEPWLHEPVPAGSWASVAGAVIGTGSGRGSAAAFVLAGLTCMAVAVAGACYGPLRRVDIDLPDLAVHSKSDESQNNGFEDKGVVAAKVKPT